MITRFYYFIHIFIFMKYKLCCSFVMIVVCKLFEDYTRAIFIAKLNYNQKAIALL